MATFEHYAQVIPAGYYNIAMIHTVATVPDFVICTYGYGGVGYTIDETDAGLIWDAWVDNFIPLFADEVVLTRMTFSDAAGLVGEVTGSEPGLSAVDGVAINSAAIIEKRTGTVGRRGRGRMFIPAVLEASTDIAGNFTVARRGVIQTAANGWLADMNAVNGAADPVLLHSKGWNGAVEPADPGNAPDPTIISSVLVNGKVGTQRRRLR